MNSLLFKPYTYVIIIIELIKLDFELGFGFWGDRVNYDGFDNRRFGYRRGRVNYDNRGFDFGIYIIVVISGNNIYKVNIYLRLAYPVPSELVRARQAD
jgi:hypothetical protein